MYIDSHVNLHAPQFAEDLPQVLARAKAADVTLMVNICDRLSNFDACYALAQAHDHIWATIGTHPHEARENPYLSAKDIVDQLRPKVIGIGECGLDYHYDYSPRDIQGHVFRAHIEASRLCGLPLVIHTREADEDMQTILTEEQTKGAFRFLLHCYTSGAVLAQAAASMGAYFSVSGIATFKAAADVRSIIQAMPEDRIIVETDCPYLAPIPMRGRRNEPAFVRYIYDALADIRGWNLTDTKERTRSAFYNLFDKVPQL
jgi:TatD DNase family protein